MTRRMVTLLVAMLCLAFPLVAATKATDTQKKSDADKKTDEKIFSGIELRNIGPALTSGRIIDLAVDPRDQRVWFVAAASGGVWKTTNAGTTFTPIFDDQGSFSIGCVTIDPNNSLTVWVGSGENNSQRSVSMGDGVYKSTDGGKTWKNVGLGKSEHIGKIVVDPRNSSVVYVAAQGPLWNPGGDRGLYKTTDGGKSWKPVLTISENTGVSDIAMDPSNPDVIYAASYQRRRHVFTLIDGGPESAIYKSTDAGATWDKLTAGLPKEDMGRIGIAVAPSDPKLVYATIEAARDTGGFFRSKDGGANWEKVNPWVSGAAQYYQEVFIDPRDSDRVYLADTWVHVTDDGGKTIRRLDEKAKHPDNHAIWIDPANSDHLLIGCDGGLYETFDRATTWEFKANLPVTQFYRIAADDALPFYNVYGGTQDNFSLGGPSRTTSMHGITNSDWFVTTGGDGFRSVPDPTDPNTLYAESQYGVLVRYDKRTGETLDIQPQPTKDMAALRFNWDSPIIVSPYDHNRLYFAAQYLFRSDDRGNSWRAISGDLTRQINRNQLPVMGRVWGIDAVAKNASTSFYGNIVSLTESPLKEGLIYAGTDDGLVQITEDGGAHWRKIAKFPGVPDTTYVSALQASSLDANTVYAAFDNHKTGDFKPYVLKSTDRGATWSSISGNLPQRGSTYAIAEDFVDPKLLFAGTEYGLYFTQDGGGSWTKLTGGMPTIAVRDLWIQKRHNDLVVGTFGRGILILDDYRPLRTKRSDIEASDATLFAPRDTPLYVERSPLGEFGKGFQGASYFTAPNPPYGAVITYYLKDELKSLKKQRWEAESKLKKDGGNEPGKPERGSIKEETPQYPTWEQIRAEENEPEPSIFLTVSDQDGNVIRRVSAPVTAGFHRVAWDLRYPAPTPVQLKEPEREPFNTPPAGPLVAPGKYTVKLSKRVGNVETALGQPQVVNVVPLYLEIMNATDRAKVLSFQERAAHLQRVAMGAAKANADALNEVKLVRKAIDETEGGAASNLTAKVDDIEKTLRDIDVQLNGDKVLAEHNEPVPPAILDRVNTAVAGLGTTSAPTQTHEQALATAEADIVPLLERMRKTIDVDLAGVRQQLNQLGAPWTPNRIPVWK